MRVFTKNTILLNLWAVKLCLQEITNHKIGCTRNKFYGQPVSKRRLRFCRIIQRAPGSTRRNFFLSLVLTVKQILKNMILLCLQKVNLCKLLTQGYRAATTRPMCADMRTLNSCKLSSFCRLGGSARINYIRDVMSSDEWAGEAVQCRGGRNGKKLQKLNILMFVLSNITCVL